MTSKPFRRGPGTPVTPGEKRRYDQLRAAGWSPEAAAESIHRSRSWAYQYEKEKRGDYSMNGVSTDGAPNYSSVDVVAVLRAARGGQEGALRQVLDFIERRYRFDSSATVWLIELLNVAAIWGNQAAKSIGQTYEQLVDGFAPYIDDDNETLYQLAFDYFANHEQEAS